MTHSFSTDSYLILKTKHLYEFEAFRRDRLCVLEEREKRVKEQEQEEKRARAFVYLRCCFSFFE